MGNKRVRVFGAAITATVTTMLGMFGPTAALADTLSNPTGAPTYTSSFSNTADPFSLASRPGSAHTIYLDFDGGDLQGTSFSSVSDPLVAWSVDADRTTFSALEKTMIRTIWENVTEDFAPFDVNVTTRLTSDDLIDRTSEDDKTFGVHVYFTDDKNKHVAGCTCGGLAYYNTTGYVGEKSAALSFTAQGYDAYYIPYIAGVASHEVGHTLGFNHNGGLDPLTSAPVEYFQDLGVYNPIMGANPSEPALTQWSNGDYANSTDHVDQVAEIARIFGGVQDDYADSKTGAKRLTAGGTISGLIGTRTDTDWFTFTVTPVKKKVNGRYTTVTPKTTITVKSGSRMGANLLPSLKIVDSTGKVVKVLDAGANYDILRLGPTNLTKTYTATLKAGTYYAVVDGIGNATPYATLWNADGQTTYNKPTTAYSDYGSLGGYRITYTSK